jgi:hypothetical protein
VLGVSANFAANALAFRFTFNSLERGQHLAKTRHNSRSGIASYLTTVTHAVVYVDTDTLVGLEAIATEAGRPIALQPESDLALLHVAIHRG